MKKEHIIIGVAALVITAATLLIFGNTIGRYFSKEHHVDNYLRWYEINSNVGISLFVTSNFSKLMNDVITNVPDPDVHRNANYEILMPTSCRSEILSIYNSFHGSNHDVLPIDENNFTGYMIYRTSLLSIHRIDMKQTEFAAYFNALRADFIEFRAGVRN